MYIIESYKYIECILLYIDTLPGTNEDAIYNIKHP